MQTTSILKKLNVSLYPEHLFYAPEWLVLGVNNVCNLHCKMCDVGVGYTDSNFSVNLTGTKPLNMPAELIEKIMDQAATFFPSVKIGYAFTEPLVYPHLERSLAYAKTKRLYTSVTTNALTLPQKAEMLCQTGLNDLFISLDGPQDIHNQIRGNASSFQKAIAGIEQLLTYANRPDISIYCVITEWNIGYLRDFALSFKKYPLKHMGFMHTNYTPAWLAHAHNEKYGSSYPATLSNTQETAPDSMNLELLAEEIAEIKKMDLPFSVSFSPEINLLSELKRFYHQPESLFGKTCNDAFRNIMIKSDGSVIPAHGRCYNLTIGNMYEQDLGSIWNSKIIANFRKDLLKAGGLFPACSRCCSAF